MFEAKKEQIEEWKSKYGSVYLIVTGDRACYLKKPSRKAIAYASTGAGKDVVKYNEILLKDCWLAGDEEIKTDDELFFSVSTKLSELIEIKEAELVKL
jgi:hypothetical protein